MLHFGSKVSRRVIELVNATGREVRVFGFSFRHVVFGLMVSRKVPLSKAVPLVLIAPTHHQARRLQQQYPDLRQAKIAEGVGQLQGYGKDARFLVYEPERINPEMARVLHHLYPTQIERIGL